MGPSMKLATDRRILRFAFAALALAGLAIASAAACGVRPADLVAAWHHLERWLTDHPVILILALAVLPALPVPSSALLVATGAVWREHPVPACAMAVTAMACNILWTYLFAAGPGHRWCSGLLARYGTNIPALPAGDHVRFILVMRLTPGMPFFIQNFLLGLLRPPLRVYLPVSIACNAPVVCGLVLSGAGLAAGSLMPLIAGVSLVVVAAVGAHFLRRKLADRRKSPETA
jgi:uncharacterized membrane protein YdjX (TVP38/TMEM64 family)